MELIGEKFKGKMKIKLLTALLALLACTSVAQAQKNYFDYTKYTYKWKGRDVGVKEVVKDENDDDAPGKMVALRDKLMYDKTIPGSVNVDGVPGQDVDYFDTIQHKDFTPVEGFTCLLYTLKKKFGDFVGEPKTAPEFASTVNSIKLLTNATECDGAYIVSFSGHFDRFYFAAKGKARQNNYWKDYTVYYNNDWELFSPTGNAREVTKDDDYNGTEDFYYNMTHNGVYYISHDCSNVPGQGHYFDIDPTGEHPERTLTNVAMVIPKDRMTLWNEGDFDPWPDSKTGYCRDVDGKFTWYHPEKSPRLAIYKAKLTVRAEQASDEFYDEGRMYSIQLNWNSNLRDEKTLNWPGTETCNLYVIKEDGTKENLDSGVNKYKFTYKVPQKEQPQVFQYYVICNPTGTNPNDPVQAITDTLTVVIPGYRGLITELGYRSRFIMSEGLNSYKNTITLYPEKETTSFRIYRKPVAIKKTSSFDESPIEIAEISMQSDGQRAQYQIYYSNQIDEQDDNRFDYNQNGWSGMLNGHPDEFIEVYDYFTEKTVADPTKRASEYIYFISKLRFNGEWSTPVEIGTAPVYSGRLTANYNTYDDHEAYYDSQDMSVCKPSKLRGLNVQDLEIDQRKYEEVSSYDIYVGDYIGYSGVKQVSVTGDNEIQGAPGTFYAGQLSVNSSYGLNTYGTNEVKKLNTNITINAKKGTSAPFDSNNNINIYGALVKFAGVTDKDIAPYVYGYSVKRDVQGETPVFLRKLNNQQFADGWSSDYSAIKAEYPTGSTTNPVLFNDIFTGDEQTNGETYYDIRMYSTDGPFESWNGQELDQEYSIYVTDIRIVVEHEQSTSDAYHTEFGYHSRFAKDAGLNSYMNTVTLSPRLENTSYKIYRKPESLNHSSTFDTTPVEIAEVKFTTKKSLVLWEITYSNQIDRDDDNRFDDETPQTMGAISTHPDQFVEIYDYFTENVVADQSKRAAAYSYLISYPQLNGEWSTPKKIGVAPVYSGELGEPEYLPSYTYLQIQEDMKMACPSERRGLKATNHADITFTDYQNEYLSQDDEEAAVRAIYHGEELAAKGSTAKLSVPMPKPGDPEFGKHVGVYVVDSPYGENTYGTAPVDVAQIGVDFTSPRHQWAWYGTEQTQKVFDVDLTIKPRLSPMFYKTSLGVTKKEVPYVYYYNVSNYDDELEDDFLLNSYEDVVGNGWQTDYAQIKETYPIGTSRTKETNIHEMRVKFDDYIPNIEDNDTITSQQYYYVRMYYTPTHSKTGLPTRTQKFYIADNHIYFDAFDEITTGVNDVNVDKSVVDVKYYNLMGVCSDKPFDGANIKVERHADGTTTTTKMMK